jgi:putative membrane protein
MTVELDPSADVEIAGRNAGKRAAVAILVTIALTAAAMILFGEAAYLWIKAVHVVAIISWMAGLLYLPRLFIYHTEAEAGSRQAATFAVMERRLLSIIMTPAMLVSWVVGLWLAYSGGYLGAGWFHGKLALVIGLSGVHGYFSAAARRFADGTNTKPARHWRIVNEIPTLLMIGIVVLVVVKPF